MSAAETRRPDRKRDASTLRKLPDRALKHNRAGGFCSRDHAGVPIPNFAYLRGALRRELKSQRGHQQLYDPSAAFEPEVRNNHRGTTSATSGPRHERESARLSVALPIMSRYARAHHCRERGHSHASCGDRYVWQAYVNFGIGTLETRQT